MTYAIREILAIFLLYFENLNAMSTAKLVKKQVLSFEKGRPFSISQLLKLGSRRAVDCALARLVAEGVLVRVSQGIYMRPKSSRYVSQVAPAIGEVVEAIASKTGETIGISGPEAAMKLKLSTQVPMTPLYYTSGPTRELLISNQVVKLKHVADRKLSLAGRPAGTALAALWYLGKEAVNGQTLATIESQLSGEVLNELIFANIPAWMADKLRTYRARRVAA